MVDLDSPDALNDVPFQEASGPRWAIPRNFGDDDIAAMMRTVARESTASNHCKTRFTCFGLKNFF
jgi:hypothetical protein